MAITSTPAGGGAAVSTAYIWCGQAICQARTAAGAVSREYVSEGELVPGAAAQPYYYGIDQIGSVRRAFASAVSAPAYAYDPYGAPLQTTTPVTDLGYAGLFYNADSGLYLANHRAYDPATGRWLSRDPLGEAADARANLYGYVGANPISGIDPSGLFCIPFTNIPFPNLFDFSNIPQDQLGPLLLTILLTETLGGGPEDPIADVLVAEEIEAAEAGDIAGGAQSALAGEGLANQLLSEQAASVFTSEGTLSEEALAASREIIPAQEIGNPDIPNNLSKFSTQSYPSPTGDFQVHFYMDPSTGEPYYGLDYKSVFNDGPL